MIIPLNDIKNEVYNFSFDELDKKVKSTLKEIIEDQPITIQGSIYPIKGGFDVSGEIKTHSPQACSFCANILAIPITEKFHEVMLMAPKPTHSKKEVVVPADDLEMHFITGNEIDLSDIVKEILEVAIPIQPKCVEKGAPANYPKCVADWDYTKFFEENAKTPTAKPFEILKNLKKN